MIHEDAPKPQTREKLQLLKSPLLNKDHDTTPRSRQPSLGLTQPDADRDIPVLERHEEPTLLEVFFDLFFAANYAVFTKNQSIYTAQQFASHVGYFSMLWMTWLVICFYDVRFITDSVFERVAKGAHLGVMVGFAVVAPNFNPSDQNAQTMRTMSLILMVSRLVLAGEYASIAWHVRKFNNAGRGLYAQIGLCFIAAMVYLGITFRFTDGNSRVFVAWYAVSATEVLLTFFLSNYCVVLGFTKTHLMKRLTLLTVIILGDGIVVMSEKVVAIVKTPAAWNPLTIGVVTAATSIVYFVFLIYFDWIREFYLPAWRQQLWTLLHFPFHLSLILWQTCFAQFIMWSKITNVLDNVEFNDYLHDPDVLATATSDSMEEKLMTQINAFFASYPPKWQSTIDAIQSVTNNITQVPVEFWPTLAEYYSTDGEAPINQTLLDEVVHLELVMWAVVQNSLFANFEIDLIGEQNDQKKLNASDPGFTNGSQEINFVIKTWERFDTVFTYGYIAIGIALGFMTVLSAITRQTPWKAWPIIRTTINLLLSAGISLIALLNLNEDHREKYLWSHWLLPTICLTQFFMLILTHVRSDGPPAVLKRTATFFSLKKNSADSVEAQYSSTPKYDPVYPYQA